MEEKLKQETRESAAFKHAEFSKYVDEATHKTAYYSFIQGVLWKEKQEQRVYSEQEVLELLLRFNNDKPGSFDASRWFEKNKK